MFLLRWTYKTAPLPEVLPPLKRWSYHKGKKEYTLYFNSFSIKVVPYFWFLTLKYFFSLGNANQFDALFMQWPQKVKTMENGLSKIHQSQRMILILEAHSIVFLQQPDYDFICKSSLFLKAQMKTEAEEVNKRQALCFTRDTFSWSKSALVLAPSMEWWQFTKEGFCLQRCIWPFCFALYFIPEVVLILAKHPKHCCPLLKLM